MTLRIRLTAVYGLLFFLAGGLVLGVTYLLLKQTLVKSDYPPVIKPAVSEPMTAEERIALQRKVEDAVRLQAKYRQDVLNSLLKEGGAALAGVGVIAVGAGWMIAGRMLRPINQITETARRVADRSLHERIALTKEKGEVRELADTFDEMLERLDRSFDGQRRFVSNASHELKTPLAINRTVIEVAVGRPDAPPQLRQLAEVLLEVNARQERLIDGLLTFARSEQTVTAATPVDLADRAACALEETSDDVGWRPDLTPAPVAGDPVLLERLVHNLVQNAQRYNVAGGWATVSTGVRAGRAALTVANTGPNVPQSRVDELFEPFRRLHDRTGSARGSGLGLSIVRSVARAHGGDVSAMSRPGGGLVVRVTLPLREN